RMPQRGIGHGGRRAERADEIVVAGTELRCRTTLPLGLPVRYFAGADGRRRPARRELSCRALCLPGPARTPVILPRFRIVRADECIVLPRVRLRILHQAGAAAVDRNSVG